jgi:hypothetical protein
LALFDLRPIGKELVALHGDDLMCLEVAFGVVLSPKLFDEINVHRPT